MEICHAIEIIAPYYVTVTVHFWFRCQLNKVVPVVTSESDEIVVQVMGSCRHSFWLLAARRASKTPPHHHPFNLLVNVMYLHWCCILKLDKMAD